MTTETQIKTLKLRLKDKHAGFLREQSRAVNFVWNFCNELSFKHFERKREFMSAYDMQPYTKGAINIRERGLKWLEQQFKFPGAMFAENMVLNKAFELPGSKAAAGRGRLVGGILAL